MPKVGNKKFSYTEKGMKQAKEYSKKTGSPMMMKKKKVMSSKKKEKTLADYV